jgi:hypothetical protein
MNQAELLEKKTMKRKTLMNRVFVWAMAFLMLLLVASIVISGYFILRNYGEEGSGGTIFEFSAVCLMTLWIALVIGYYAWAIYFYNINLGLTDQDWAEVRAQKKIDPTVEEREVNPNKEQTLGLPPGTVRGTLTLTLMVASISIAIAYMGEESSLRNDQFFIDNFDFFKQAFLMMIAFYFGSKSLEYISKTGKIGKEITEADLGLKPKGMTAENMDITVENIDAENVDIDADLEGSVNQPDSDFNKEGSVG